MQSVAVSADLYLAIQWMANDAGMSIPELIADAVALKVATSEAERRGCRLLIERNGRVQQLVRAQ